MTYADYVIRNLLMRSQNHPKFHRLQLYDVHHTRKQKFSPKIKWILGMAGLSYSMLPLNKRKETREMPLPISLIPFKTLGMGCVRSRTILFIQYLIISTTELVAQLTHIYSIQTGSNIKPHGTILVIIIVSIHYTLPP